MSTLLSSLGIDRLSVAERLQLIQEIWDSIDADAGQQPVSEAQRRELDRRLAALEAQPDRVVPWQEVEARAMARFKK
jgi:putative addiction module component (TIGR02574 family)